MCSYLEWKQYKIDKRLYLTFQMIISICISHSEKIKLNHNPHKQIWLMYKIMGMWHFHCLKSFMEQSNH